MPAIELVPVPLYQPNDPYNHQVDNLPIQGLIDRILLVNSQVDIDATILSDAQGTQGTLSNRLSQSINPDGSLKTAAVNATRHNIAEHTDGYVLVNGTPVSYVRMLLDERAKLQNIASEATNLKILVELNTPVPSSLPSQISVVGLTEVEFIDATMKLSPSDSIYWTVEADGSVQANTTFPASVRHQHHYDIVPVPQNVTSPDYKNYVVTSVATAYQEGSLRVYVNGVRLTRTANVTQGRVSRGNYVPTTFGGGSPVWMTYTYAEDASYGGVVSTGKFSLSGAVTPSDVVTVDFDTLYVN